jgi:hypothetical protein
MGTEDLHELKTKCEDVMPYEMEALSLLDEIEPEDIDMYEHVNSVIDTVVLGDEPIEVDM